MEFKDAYICYNSKDLDWVRRLAEQLESETIDGAPSSRTLAVFFDRWDMGPGQSLIDKMNEGMLKARHLIVIMTPEFLAADWPRFEWKHIVASDPNNESAKIIPILLRDLGLDGKTRIVLPAPFMDLKYIDFRRTSDFRPSFFELVRKIRNMPPLRGRRLAPLAGQLQAVVPGPSQAELAWLPDPVPEFLFSNLLAVSRFPTQIWTAATKFRESTKQEIWEQVPECNSFILRSGNLYTFGDLSDENEPLRAVIDTDSIKAESRNDWFLSVDRERWLIALMNSCLARALRKKSIRTDGVGRFYFVPLADGLDRIWKMRIGKPRTVAKRIIPHGGESEFWVHHGAKLRFRLLGQKVFLQVVPLYLFTQNGHTTIKGKAAGKLSHMWMDKQQNVDIFRDLLFWGLVLADGEVAASISTGGDSLQIETTPAAARLQVGIANDRVDIRTLMNFQDSELEDAASNIVDLDSDEEEAGDEEEE
jgi:hypothetical protein